MGDDHAPARRRLDAEVLRRLLDGHVVRQRLAGWRCRPRPHRASTDLDHQAEPLKRDAATAGLVAGGWPVGKVVPFTFAPLGFDRTLFRVAEQDIGTGSSCAMVLDGESPDIYAWDADDRPPVNAASAIVYDPMKTPVVLAIGEVEATVEDQGEQLAQQAEQLEAIPANGIYDFQVQLV